MPSTTTAFSLISLADIKAVRLTSTPIPRSRLRHRIVFMRTSRGNYAKLFIQAGDNLHIRDLVLYNSSGCIIRTASNRVIRSSSSFDVDTAHQTSTNADLWWHGISAGDHELVPKNGSALYTFPDFDSISFNAIRAATYTMQRIPREWLRLQVIYCRTSQNRFAKLLLEWTTSYLIVRRLKVFNSTGTTHIDRSNIKIPRRGTLDLDTGNLSTGSHDLSWHAVNAYTHYLKPTNGARLSFESFFQYEKYEQLLKMSTIRTSLVISGSANRNYNGWTEIEKLQLREFLYLLENDQPLPIPGPPSLAANRYLNPCDATKIYMAHVAQSFWVDANNKVAWKLNTASLSHRRHLFDMRLLFRFTPGSGHHFDSVVMGTVTHWSPGISYKFLLDNGMIKSDMWGTIKALTEWVRVNLFHIAGFAGDFVGGPFASQQDQWEYIFGYRGQPPVDKMIAPLPGRKHITHGCWGTDGFFAAVLRTVNIPVKHGRSNFSGRHHSRPEFFTVGKNLSHGDDPYNVWVNSQINTIPIERLFYTDADITRLIDAPAARPGKTVPETASYNHEKYSKALGIEFKTRYLLYLRCRDRASGINTGEGSKVWEKLHDFYTNTQIARIVADCERAIVAISGGCGTIYAT